MSKKALKRRALEQAIQAPHIQRPQTVPHIRPEVMIGLNATNDCFVIQLGGHAVTIPYKPVESCSCKHVLSEARFGIDQQVVTNPGAKFPKMKTINVPTGYGERKFDCDVPEHQLTVENKSLRALHELLLARKLAAASGERVTIGTRADPTQALIEAFLAKGGKVQDDSERARQELVKKYGDEAEGLISGLDLSL